MLTRHDYLVERNTYDMLSACRSLYHWLCRSWCRETCAHIMLTATKKYLAYHVLQPSPAGKLSPTSKNFPLNLQRFTKNWHAFTYLSVEWSPHSTEYLQHAFFVQDTLPLAEQMLIIERHTIVGTTKKNVCSLYHVLQPSPAGKVSPTSKSFPLNLHCLAEDGIIG